VIGRLMNLMDAQRNQSPVGRPLEPASLILPMSQTSMFDIAQA